ncbi:hypothetical protein J6590_034715 [Homalodisca vitripennis]|nr:hypothetical protein J6590_034715 [Homalodisca vitripennis]
MAHVQNMYNILKHLLVSVESLYKNRVVCSGLKDDYANSCCESEDEVIGSGVWALRPGRVQTETRHQIKINMGEAMVGRLSAWPPPGIMSDSQTGVRPPRGRRLDSPPPLLPLPLILYSLLLDLADLGGGENFYARKGYGAAYVCCTAGREPRTARQYLEARKHVAAKPRCSLWMLRGTLYGCYRRSGITEERCGSIKMQNTDAAEVVRTEENDPVSRRSAVAVSRCSIRMLRKWLGQRKTIRYHGGALCQCQDAAYGCCGSG